jgi:hypothetical protein
MEWFVQTVTGIYRAVDLFTDHGAYTNGIFLFVTAQAATEYAIFAMAELLMDSSLSVKPVFFAPQDTMHLKTGEELSPYMADTPQENLCGQVW